MSFSLLEMDRVYFSNKQCKVYAYTSVFVFNLLMMNPLSYSKKSLTPYVRKCDVWKSQNYYAMVMFVIYHPYFVRHKDLTSARMDNINNKVMRPVLSSINLNVAIFSGRNFNYVSLKKYLIF